MCNYPSCQYCSSVRSSVSGPSQICFPAKCNQAESSHLGEFREVCHRLSIYNNLALLDKRIVILHALRKVVLGNLHFANQGVTGMHFRANQCTYWPGLELNVCNHRGTCTDCISNAPSQHWYESCRTIFNLKTKTNGLLSDTFTLMI